MIFWLQSAPAGAWRAIDSSILRFVYHFTHRSATFDHAIVLLSGNTFLKGAIVVAVIWWLWFRTQNDIEKQESVLAAIIAGFAGLALARLLALILPFRLRPLDDPQLAPQFPTAMAGSFERWSSFPSDHAVLFFAIATGLFFVSRRAALFIFAYITLIVCLPRLYLGIHYPTDIFAGVALGVGLGWFFHLSAVRRAVTWWPMKLLNYDAAFFYGCFFIVTYQIAELFESVREVGRFLIQLYRA
ncbi:MAG TPA: phosphatase PAP2 family protein [Terriglobales bacterium]|nr:phosphatase PAP2 family protein [Terriglobales bacterium]